MNEPDPILVELDRLLAVQGKLMFARENYDEGIAEVFGIALLDFMRLHGTELRRRASLRTQASTAPDGMPVVRHNADGTLDEVVGSGETDPIPSVSAIERDEDFDRTYIPLPGGWEVQTKGKGSTFRICEPDHSRLPIPDSPYLHETLERMARDIHAHIATLESALAEARRDGERYRWLAMNANRIDTGPADNGVRWEWEEDKHGVHDKSLDAAIDAAMGATHES